MTDLIHPWPRAPRESAALRTRSRSSSVTQLPRDQFTETLLHRPLPVPATTEEKIAQDEFKTAYDSWTQRALAEFPNLGVANSRLNLAFLARVQELRERNADELKYPNWPYLLATQVNAQFLATNASPVQSSSQAVPSPKPQASVTAIQPKPVPVPPKNEVTPSKSGPAVVSAAVSGAETIPMAGTKRAVFLSGCGVRYDPCGSFAGMHKLVNGEARVAIIDLGWTDYRQIVSETDYGLAPSRTRVRKEQLMGLKIESLKNVNLYFAHCLDQPTRNMSLGTIKMLFEKRNWKIIGGPDQKMGFTEFSSISSDYYDAPQRFIRNSPSSIPMDIFMKKYGWDWHSFRSGVSGDMPSAERESAIITEKATFEKLPPNWQKFEVPVLAQPIYAVFKEADATSVLPLLRSLMESGLKSGDLR